MDREDGSKMSDLKSSEDSDNNSEEEDDDEDVAAPPPEGMYDPSDYEYLNVSSEIKELFNYIVRYTPQTIEIETRFKPFIPEYIPAVGDIDAFLKGNSARQNNFIIIFRTTIILRLMSIILYQIAFYFLHSQ